MAWWTRNKGGAAGGEAGVDMPLIRLEHITKVFKGDDAEEETRALWDVSVDIGRGEYVSVSGPSGCGKSTFLSILAMLDTPTSGRYFLNGRAVDRLPPAEKARLRNIEIGLIFQSFNLIGDMSVYENVEYPSGCAMRAPRIARRGSKRRWNVWGCPGAPSSGPGSCRAATSSSSRSRGRSPDGRRFCSQTSRPATSTRRPATI